jgi:hypothetical protein
VPLDLKMPLENGRADERVSRGQASERVVCVCETVSVEKGARRPPLQTAVVCPPGRRRRRLAVVCPPGRRRRRLAITAVYRRAYCSTVRKCPATMRNTPGMAKIQNRWRRRRRLLRTVQDEIVVGSRTSSRHDT